jgi:hypothetical protein
MSRPLCRAFWYEIGGSTDRAAGLVELAFAENIGMPNRMLYEKMQIHHERLG